MDEQLRSEFFSLFFAIFDQYVCKEEFEAQLYEEFLKFACQNHTQSFSYGKECTLKFTIEDKVREVFNTIHTKDGKLE